MWEYNIKISELTFIKLCSQIMLSANVTGLSCKGTGAN